MLAVLFAHAALAADGPRQVPPRVTLGEAVLGSRWEHAGVALCVRVQKILALG